MIPEELIGSVSIRLYAGVSGMTARKIAREIIIDVLSAVAEGKAKFIDEVGRRELGEYPYAPSEWAWTMIGKGARTFVALSGTGKEEGGDVKMPTGFYPGPDGKLIS